MKKQHIFISIIALGLLGRWILVPSIKRLKSEATKEEKAKLKQKSEDCLTTQVCTIYELASDIHSSSQKRLKARELLIKNWKSFLQENKYLTWKLRGKFISADDTLESLLASKQNLKTLLDGLYLCHDRVCLDFFKKHREYFFKNFYEESAKLSFKEEGPWSKKSKVLKELLRRYDKEETQFKAVALIDFIPNHPLLKRFIEYHYLKINSRLDIEKATLHLSRYANGWHDRAYKKVLNSKSKSHINYYLKFMNVGCPSRVKLIYNYWDKWAKDTQVIALDQGRYLLKDDVNTMKKIGLEQSSLIGDAKCQSGLNTF